MSQAIFSPIWGLRDQSRGNSARLNHRRAPWGRYQAEELMWNGTCLGLLAIGLGDTVHGGSAEGGGGRH